MRKTLVGNLILLIVYYISAHFTLSLGLPPIGGTPVWVPTGISLGAVLVWGYRLLPAVFIGDFIIGAELVGLNDSTSIIIAILFGLQASGHAGLATWVLRKYKLWPGPLIQETKILTFFAIAAGLTLFITTLVFGFTEWALGVLPSKELLQTLFMWWAGGAIGVVIFTPLVLILFSQPRQEWRSRGKTVAMPLLLIFVILIISLYLARDHDRREREEIFNENVVLIHSITNGELAKAGGKLLLLPLQHDRGLVGEVAQSYDYHSIFNPLLLVNGEKWLDLTVTDITDNNSPHVLFDSKQINNDKNINHNTQLIAVKNIDIAGRTWQLDYSPTQIFMTKYANWTLYWIMSSALLVLSLISVLLLAMTGRIRQVKNEVKAKTHQLQESEHKYRRLIESIDTEYIIYSQDINGIFDYISPSISNILGYSQKEFLTHRSKYMPDSELNRNVERYIQQTLSGNSSNYEIEMFDKERYIHTLAINERPQFNSKGEIVGVEGIAHDITSHKEAQQDLEKLSLAVKHSPSAVVITNKKGIIEYVNPKFTLITGYCENDVIGKYPDIVSSGLTDPNIYKELWKTLLKGHEWKGELQNRKKNGELYWAQELIAPVFDADGNITNFVATQEDITEVRRLNEQTSYQASHDLLTGLINRHEFEIRLKRSVDSAKRDSSEHALAYLDLDQFKIVNDTCGHVAGDELLRQVGNLMQHNMRSRDTLARLGGDEFTVLMEYCGIEQAHQACQQTIELLQKFRFHWEEHSFTIGVSIGLAIIDRHTHDSNEALKHADSACYAAKDAGRNQVAVHTEANQRLQQREGDIQWNSEITDALDNDRFLLYVQPIIPVSTSDTGISYEVLLRMKMPDGTIVPPGAFLPAAERYNSSIKIDRWVISHTLRWISQHADQLNHVNVFNINLSGQTIGDEAMLGFILKEIENGDVPGEKIKFEITETAAIANLRDATVFMKTLSEYGCSFALDDFGSGLSSFAYLKNLNVDSIKVDGMFVKNMATDRLDFEMVKAINDIGHVMGLETVAEFVESEEVMDKLREIGVDSAQGYELGRPVPIDDISHEKQSE